MRALFCSRLLLLTILSGPGILGLKDAAAQQLTLHEAIVLFQEAWRVDLSYNAALLDGRGTQWTHPTGNSAEADLNSLLEGTGLVSTRLSSGTFSLVPAARTGILTGEVLHDSTAQPLPRAHVLVRGEHLDAITDLGGRFTVGDLPPGEYTVRAQHIGYASAQARVSIAAGETTELALHLRQITHELEPAHVVANSSDIPIPHSLADMLVTKEISQIGGLGTADLIKNLDRVSGLRVSDLSNDIHIQGGDAGEHRFVLDGSPVYSPVHLLGLVGAMNPYAINQIEVSKAGFGASKGSYLSGVLHSTHAVRDTSRFYADMHIDPVSFNALAGARIGKSFNIMGAVRTSTWNSVLSRLRSSAIDSLLLSWSAPDKFLQRASFYTVQSVNPALYELYLQRLDNLPSPDLPDVDFNDMHLAGRLDIGVRHALRPSYYRGSSGIYGRRLIDALLEDDESIAEPDLYDWKNENVQLTWSYIFHTTALATVRARVSRYQLSHSYAGLNRQTAIPVLFDRLFFNLEPADDGNRIREFALDAKLDAEHAFGSFQTGVEVVSASHSFVLPSIFPQSIDHSGTSSRLVIYAEDTNRIASGLEITAGSRFTYIGAHRKLYAEPRVALTLGFGRTLTGRLAAGQYYQFVNQFDVTTFSPSTIVPYARFWLPVDASLKPPRALHLAGDISIVPISNWALRLEGYYKKLLRLYRVDYPTLFRPDPDETVFRIPEAIETQDGFMDPTHGYAYGGSASLEFSQPWLHIRLQSEVSIAEREYEFRGGDTRIEPVPWSEPFRAHLYLDLTPLRGFSLKAHWYGGWGRVWGFQQAYFDFLGMDVDQPLVVDDFDFRYPSTDAEHQLPPTRQLDLGVAFSEWIRSIELRAQVNLINATDRRNVAHYMLREVPAPEPGPGALTSRTKLVKESRHLLGRALVISLQVHF